jgi:hypothetical protein
MHNNNFEIFKRRVNNSNCGIIIQVYEIILLVRKKLKYPDISKYDKIL